MLGELDVTGGSSVKSYERPFMSVTVKGRFSQDCNVPFACDSAFFAS